MIPATVPPRKPGEPFFGDVDNPGDWHHQSSFRPYFNKKREYLYHRLPTGATPVPENEDGERVHGDWTFHYSKWEKGDLEESSYRDNAGPQELFPKEQRGTSISMTS